MHLIMVGKTADSSRQGGGTRKRAAMNVRSAGSRRSKSEKRSAQGEEEHKKQSGPIYER